MTGRWTGRWRAWLVALALSSLAGFVEINAAVFHFDTGLDGLVGGPLAGVPAPFDDGLVLLTFVLPPLVFALATWRLGLRGALVALVGFVIVGEYLFFALSPLSTDSTGVRDLVTYSAIVIGIPVFLIVAPITLAIRWTWRRFRPAGSPDPPAVS